MSGITIGYSASLQFRRRTPSDDGRPESSPSRRPPIPGASYPVFFEPIFPEIAKLYWATDEVPMRADAIDTEDYARMLAVPVYSTKEFVCYSPGTHFPRFGAMLADDWMTLLGLAERPDDQTLARLLHGAPTSAIRNPAVQIWISNTDGVAWHVWCREDPVVQRLVKHLASFEGVRVEETRLFHG